MYYYKKHNGSDLNYLQTSNIKLNLLNSDFIEISEQEYKDLKQKLTEYIKDQNKKKALQTKEAREVIYEEEINYIEN